MKKLLLSLLVFLSLNAFSQAPNFVGGSHGRLVLFCGYDVLKVMPILNSYLTRELDYTSAAYTKKFAPHTNIIMTSAYTTRISSKPTKVNTEYYGHAEKDGTSIVDKCIIEGNWNMVANIFVSYWETKMNLDDVKRKGSITKFTLTDKIVFNTTKDGRGEINVTKNN